ncbi:MAG TPA: APC family permease [Mycobacteriales bacterium]|jgi:amino acid transporter|nr:APC family permease [Mycobacteriales bacterium]
MTVTAVGAVKRLVVGRPLRSAQLHETLLPKWLALPVFCSDPISSVAYATEQIVLVLAAGGAVYLHYAWWVAAAVTILLLVVVASYRQTCHAYPNGGGAFAVSLANFGPTPALVAASALLVDYVMTVAVSVVSGVLAVTSAFPGLVRHTELLSIACVAVLVLANLRGVRESGRAFAVPTYAFIGLTMLMFLFAAVRAATTGLPDAVTATQSVHRTVQVGGMATMLLVLRAFASGCTALTGVEAISNGVPSFRRPKAHNAAMTLAVMGGLAVSMFAGVTVLALHVHARAQASGTPSVISQVAAVSFGHRALLYYAFQTATAAILILAANTAFNGFPVLSSILAQERYLPRQLHNRGDKLVFSNGIVLLATAAGALIIGFHANLDHLLQLYIIGVFTSFTLSQAGMVRHWNRRLQLTDRAERNTIHRARVINTVGAVFTGVVLVVVIVSKVQHGAWIAILAMLILFAMMRGIRRHYDDVRHELDLTSTEPTTLPARNHALILVSQLHLPTVRAVAYARATRPSSLAGVTVDLDEDDTRQLMADWERQEMPIPLVVLESPYREIIRPVLDYVRGLRSSPRDVVTVFIPEYVVGHWWEHLLHNQSALRLKARLLFEPGVMVTSVPWQMRSTAQDGSVSIGASSPGPGEGPWRDDRRPASP